MAAVHDLYGLDPDEFVAARDQLAKELRAADVKKLRRPTVALWALNQVARRNPEAVTELHEAADAARSAQDLRAALARRRDASSAVLREARAALAEAGRAPEQHERAVEDALTAIVSSAGLLDALARGELSSLDAPPGEDDAGDDDLTTLLAASARGASPRPQRGAAETDRPPSPELVAARTDVESRQRDLRAATAAIEEAKADVDRAKAALDAARFRERDAKAALDEAKARVADLEG